MATPAEVVPKTEIAQRQQPFAQGTALAAGETSVSAVAAQARALVEARFAMALYRPRDMDAVRVKLLAECRRPGFAEVARYKRPVGKQQNEDTGEWEDKHAEGPSIRFIEAALRNMGNIDVSSPTIYDDDERRIIRISVIDLETNTTYSRDIAIEKIAEQKRLRKNQQPLGTRTNSYGEVVYIVRATESQTEVKGASSISKNIRTLGQRLVPGDLLEECMALCVYTKEAKIKEDPAGARKRMIDGFAELGVKPEELKKYAGQDLDSLSPAQIGDLRDLYLSIKDGITTWADVLDARESVEDEQPDAEGLTAMDRLRERTKQHAAKVKADKEAEKAAAAAAPAAAQGAAGAPQAGQQPQQQPDDKQKAEREAAAKAGEQKAAQARARGAQQQRGDEPPPHSDDDNKGRK